MFWSLCKNREEESEQHLLKCSKILETIDDQSVTSAIYKDIFSNNLEDQVRITKLFSKVAKCRQTLQKKLLSDPY